MPTLNFVSDVTVITADWLNDIDAYVYDGSHTDARPVSFSNTLAVTGAVTFSSTLTQAGAITRSWTSSNTDVDGLIGGSAIGTLVEGTLSGHYTVGLRSNDIADGFQVISKQAAASPSTDPYTKLCFEVKADGTVATYGNTTINGTLTSTGVVFSSQLERTSAGALTLSASDASGSIDMRTGGSSRLSINSGGNTTVTGTFTANGLASLGAGYNALGTSTIVVNSVNPALRITQTGTGNTLLVEDSANPDASPFVIDAAGNTVIGATTAQVYGFGGQTPNFQVNGTTGSRLGISRWTADGNPAILHITKSRGASVGTRGIVSNGDDFGYINFEGDDGVAFIAGAAIYAEVDGTPGVNDMPGRLSFATTPDGTAAVVERIRIKSTGSMRFIPLAADPSGGEAGDVYYNSTTNKLRCHNGTTWNDLF